MHNTESAESKVLFHVSEQHRARQLSGHRASHILQTRSIKKGLLCRVPKYVLHSGYKTRKPQLAGYFSIRADRTLLSYQRDGREGLQIAGLDLGAASGSLAKGYKRSIEFRQPASCISFT